MKEVDTNANNSDSDGMPDLIDMYDEDDNDYIAPEHVSVRQTLTRAEWEKAELQKFIREISMELPVDEQVINIDQTQMEISQKPNTD
jgi:hypothetical protein